MVLHSSDEPVQNPWMPLGHPSYVSSSTLGLSTPRLGLSWAQICTESLPIDRRGD